MGSIDGVGYNISKWGNVAVTRSFELAKPSPYDVEGIKAYALCPWFADTAMVRYVCRRQIVFRCQVTKKYHLREGN